MSFAETLQAEAEVVFLSGIEKGGAGPKVRALGSAEERQNHGEEKPKREEGGWRKFEGREDLEERSVATSSPTRAAKRGPAAISFTRQMERLGTTAAVPWSTCGRTAR